MKTIYAADGQAPFPDRAERERVSNRGPLYCDANELLKKPTADNAWGGLSENQSI